MIDTALYLIVAESLTQILGSSRRISPTLSIGISRGHLFPLMQITGVQSPFFLSKSMLISPTFPRKIHPSVHQPTTYVQLQSDAIRPTTTAKRNIHHNPRPRTSTDPKQSHPSNNPVPKTLSIPPPLRRPRAPPTDDPVGDHPEPKASSDSQFSTSPASSSSILQR